MRVSSPLQLMVRVTLPPLGGSVTPTLMLLLFCPTSSEGGSASVKLARGTMAKLTTVSGT